MGCRSCIIEFPKRDSDLNSRPPVIMLSTAMPALGIWIHTSLCSAAMGVFLFADVSKLAMERHYRCDSPKRRQPSEKGHKDHEGEGQDEDDRPLERRHVEPCLGEPCAAPSVTTQRTRRELSAEACRTISWSGSE